MTTAGADNSPGLNAHNRYPHTTKARRLSGGPRVYVALLACPYGRSTSERMTPERCAAYGQLMKVYLSRDQLWRIEVRDDGWVYVYHRSTPMGRYRSLREAAEWLVDQGVTELVEN